MVRRRATSSSSSRPRRRSTTRPEALVKAANTGGGEDNITVVLFAVDGDAARVEETLVAAATAGATARPEDLEDTLTPRPVEVPPPAHRTGRGRRHPGRRSGGGARRLLYALPALGSWRR